LTCISSWHICILNIILIYETIIEKVNGNCHISFLSPRAITPSIIIGSTIIRTWPASLHDTSVYQISFESM
jgi:hypothetical protein